MELYRFVLEDVPDPLTAFAPLSADPYSLFFDSADRAHPAARYSFIAFHPFETIEAKDGWITVTNRDQQRSLRGDPFEILNQRLESRGMDRCARTDLPPFLGGAAGFFGYDLARTIELLPDHATTHALPDMAIGLYDKIVAFDHDRNKSWLLIHAPDEKGARAKHRDFRALLTHKYPPAPPNSVPSWINALSRAEYESRIRKTIEYIHAGDIFQANLSQRFEAARPPGFDPFSHYCVLREVNAAPFAAYMNFGDLVLSSTSPERFLLVKDRRVETRPIKGTRPRSADPEKDEALRRELLGSLKDHAENIMIVDLMRNDLSKVCDDFSVEVPALCTLESFARVHHLVSTVTGTLGADRTPCDLLAACFPGGSVTGAPKVRAMEVIDELEPARRGPYCGAMGYIGFNGTMDTNIAIRTLVYEPGKIWFNTGGGIVVDSEPAAEYQETLDKAEAIFKSFDAQHCGMRNGAQSQ